MYTWFKMYKHYSQANDPLLGTWKEISVDDVESIPKAMGVPQEIMDGYNSVRKELRLTITRDGDTYKNKWEAPGMPDSEDTFTIGKAFTQQDFVGNDSTILHERISDRVILETKKCPGKYEIKITRTMSEDGNTMTMVEEAGTAKATCVWVRC